MNEYIASLVDELYQLGVRHAVFSPGSRSTTLAMLFQSHGGFHTYMNIDERSAGFMALGIAKAQGEPAVLVCTSGSALTHYGPAVVEAKHSGVPMIILSADRPYTLQQVGAPQTIDQQKYFGTAVNYYEELSVPSESHYYTYPRQVARRAYLKANDHKLGPVHINVPLFEPLVPNREEEYFTQGRSANPFRLVKHEEIGPLVSLLDGKRVLILGGPSVTNPKTVVEFAERIGAVVIGDPLSNLRQYEGVISTYDAFLAHHERWEELRPDVVIQLGQIPVSKRIQQWMATLTDIDYITVSPNADVVNPSLTTTIHVMASVDVFLGELCRGLFVIPGLSTRIRDKEQNLFNISNVEDSNVSTAGDELGVQQENINEKHRVENGSVVFAQYTIADIEYVKAWQQIESDSRQQLDKVQEEPTLFEGRTIHMLQHMMPHEGQILVANSMSIRDMDYFWASGRSQARVYGNRGTNGIDGTVSTALGISTNGKPTVMVTGDLSFFHDLNGLAIGKTHGMNLTIILHNNDGGGIFQYLPQKGADDFDYLFNTPQGIDYSGLATMYGLDYVKVTTNAELELAMKQYIGTEGIHIIEVPTSKEISRELHKVYRVQ
ncbi:2-succinyl-5-enolpyruvyl-6-hydroxy-3-cyclohexene-1-carboxylic-acid synthase [Veillonella sp. 3310]|uniref:2-succinyl-5-enolpyruvyl-6-hydroxy-3- cyclohexene-1-carboxylic-acid synthase n=1 Tax=Veillonella sp. 3310 TaxID=2490956 RepID=UPI000FD6A411|nr:2-succinyl-5-enolpyruvyl-6-hydroxy-3-cyclohexene-1-carboxylic-acid synthase [Veillonella sp. 3310]